MSLFKKERDEAGSSRSGRIPTGISRRQIVPTVLLVAAGVAVSVIISDIPVGVRQAFSVSADASQEVQLYRDFSPADVDVLKEHADAPVHEFSVIAGQLAEIKSAVEKTSYDTEAPHVTDHVEETAPAETAPAAPIPEETTAPRPAIIEELIDRSGEQVSSSNKNLYKSNYSYGAASLPYSGGGAGFNSSGVPMSELALPASLQFDENGEPKDYIYAIDGYATAYSGGGMTATGTTVYQGCVAVDPREIPYGTEMWIVSLDGKYVYGYCRAEDTGGFIYWEHGATVDLYMHSEADCDDWGFRGVRIYILPTSY